MISCAAVMQPYVFPYIGYFNLIEASDAFVFYDDVHYINRGWINRNRVLINGAAHTFTVPLAGASQNRLIMDVALHELVSFRAKFLRQLGQAYARAPYFQAGISYVETVLRQPCVSIADLAIHSVEQLYVFLGLSRKLFRSSATFGASRGMERADRLIEITRALGATRYVNALGGMDLYEQEYFRQYEVELNFVRPVLAPYRQGGHDFVPGLSIIDVVMNNDVETVASLIRQYELVGENP